MLTLILVGFAAGLLTVLSPCILPILPVVLSGSVGGKGRPYGIIVGFVLSFSLFTVLLSAFVRVLHIDVDVLRYIAAFVLIFMGGLLLFPALQNRFNRLIPSMNMPGLSGAKTNPDGTVQASSGFWPGFIIGISLGLVWTPCAGPILATVITLAATAQHQLESFFIVLAYALGASSLMLVVVLGSRTIIEKVRGLNNHLDTIHRVFGVIILLFGLALATGYDRTVQNFIIVHTPAGITDALQSIEKGNDVSKGLQNLKGQQALGGQDDNGQLFNVTGKILAPDFVGINAWVNSTPLTIQSLRGKVVVVDFWTYSCINCLRTLPYLNSWYEKYKDYGLVIVGVHSPEFPFEQKLENVQKAVKDYGVSYPVALDNDFKTWNAYSNEYWPATYFIDKDGYIRRVHFGEGNYVENEDAIRALLVEAGAKLDVPAPLTEAPVPVAPNQSPETYLGYNRASNFANGAAQIDNKPADYTLKQNLQPNNWSLGGNWQINAEDIQTMGDTEVLNYNFSAKEVYLVMGSDNGAQATVKLNGQPIAAADSGEDVKAGIININDYRLYKIIKLQDFAKNQTLQITFPKGVRLNAFTFGS